MVAENVSPPSAEPASLLFLYKSHDHCCTRLLPSGMQGRAGGRVAQSSEVNHVEGVPTRSDHVPVRPTWLCHRVPMDARHLCKLTFLFISLSRHCWPSNTFTCRRRSVSLHCAQSLCSGLRSLFSTAAPILQTIFLKLYLPPAPLL